MSQKCVTIHLFTSAVAYGNVSSLDDGDQRLASQPAYLEPGLVVRGGFADHVRHVRDASGAALCYLFYQEADGDNEKRGAPVLDANR